MAKIKTQNSEQLKVIPFTGYLHQPEPEKQTAAPSVVVLFMALLFIAGLSLGAISVHQSADYSQLQTLKNQNQHQAKQLSEIKKSICN